MFKIKNIIILVVIGVVLFLVYTFFIKSKSESNLVSSTVVSTMENTTASLSDASVAKDFLDLLLSVKNIKLNDAVFLDGAFQSLKDSSITLTGDGSEGRPNPFAPLGSDNVAPVIPPISTITPTTPSAVTPTIPAPTTTTTKKP